MEARAAALRFLLDSAPNGAAPAKLSVGDVLDVAAMAHSFVEHPYWRRMSNMLANTEKAELETLLDPTQSDVHALSRASVAMIRKLLAMPHVDIAQGDQAVKAVENHRERFGETSLAHHSAESAHYSAPEH